MRPRPSPLTSAVPLRARTVLTSFLSVSVMGACASATQKNDRATVGTNTAASDVTAVRHVDMATPALPPVHLAGARCPAGPGPCTCRAPGDDAEKTKPAEGMKRLEIRLSADGGEAALESPTLGRFTATGARENCFYVDVLAGSKSPFHFTSRATNASTGVTPRLAIAEYGPAGPWWYDVLAVSCVGVAGRCDRAGADAWNDSLKQRKRGRLDPCGSMVVTGLGWDTSDGEASRDGGLYRDFMVNFDLETKKFVTKLAPHSPECSAK